MFNSGFWFKNQKIKLQQATIMHETIMPKEGKRLAMELGVIIQLL